MNIHINDLSSKVDNVYVGTDSKLHLVKGGADTVLPFKQGVYFAITMYGYLNEGNGYYGYMFAITTDDASQPPYVTGLYTRTNTTNPTGVIVNNDYLTLTRTGSHDFTTYFKKNGYKIEKGNTVSINAKTTLNYSDFYNYTNTTFYFK